MSRSTKKLVSFSATSAPTTEVCKEVCIPTAAEEIPSLERVSYIHHLVRFKKDQAKVQALIDSGSKVNAMTPTYTAKIGLKVQPTDVGAQKIDGSTLETFGMVLASFQVEDKLGRARFFQETFLVVNTSVAVTLGMLFLTFSDTDILFAERELT